MKLSLQNTSAILLTRPGIIIRYHSPIIHSGFGPLIVGCFYNSLSRYSWAADPSDNEDSGLFPFDSLGSLKLHIRLSWLSSDLPVTILVFA